MKSENGKSTLMGIDFNINSDTLPQDESLKKIQGRYSPGAILLLTLVGIAVAEIIAMIVVYYQRHLPYTHQVMIDTVIMTAIIFPLLYFMSFRPILQHVQQRYQVERILQTRLRIIKHASSHALNEVLQFSLDELESLTNSQVGYFHFVGRDQKTIKLEAWSTNTIQNMCKVKLDGHHYSVEEAGVWADCIREGRAVIHNDYASLPHRKGLPDGHTPIIREMAVPVVRNNEIVAVLGVGNKPKDYTARDIELVSTLADFSWDIFHQKQAGDALRVNEEKLRTLTDWTYDWELWLSPNGEIIHNSPSCERITGYKPEEMINAPDLLISIVHSADKEFYENHHQLIHDEAAGVEKVEYRIIARDGEEHWIEHICRPVFGVDNRYLGRRISNRDITQRKQAEKEVEDRNKRERILTQTIHTMQMDIARDIHDTIGQNIGFLRMKLDHLSDKKTYKKAELQSELMSMTKAANESYDLIRGTLAMLQSSDASDLSRVFSRYAEQVEERSSIRVEFSGRGRPKPLSANRMRQLFYIYREALNNVEKHAKAELMVIKLQWDEENINMTVSDNGIGFDPLQTQYGSHYGLKFMRERAELLNGSLDVNSEVGSGTKLVVRVPYD